MIDGYIRIIESNSYYLACLSKHNDLHFTLNYCIIKATKEW